MRKAAIALVVGLLVGACGPMTEEEQAAFARGMAQSQGYNYNSSNYQPGKNCYKTGNVVQCY